MAIRPKTLAVGVCPVVMGTVLAFRDGLAVWWVAGLALLGAVLVQIGTNLANDYYDFKKGADTEDRLGPVRVTQSGLIRPEGVKRAFLGCFSGFFLVALILMIRGGWPLLAIGISSVFFGWLYTGGPYPLAYLGLGDVAALVFFGPVAVAGTYFVQALSVSWGVIGIGIAPGLFSVAILAVNNLRDIEQDRVASKKTLAVRFGKLFVILEYGLSLILACWIVGGLTWLVLVAALPVFKVVLTENGRVLNRALAQTGGLLVLFTVLFCLK